MRYLIALFTLTSLICQAEVKQKFDWKTFMSQHDLIWDEIPLQWNEGAFVGNGQLGMMIYANMEDNRLDFSMGRQDVTDHRGAPNNKTSMGMPETDLLDYSRLDIGRMVLRPQGKIISASIRQHLYDAEIVGVIKTTEGELTFRALTTYDKMLNIIEVSSTEKEEYKWEWKAGNPNSPRYLSNPTRFEDSNYKFNPKPIIKKEGEVSICEQRLLAGGDYATAWQEQKESKSASTLFLSIANEIPAAGQSAKVATSTVKEAISLSLKDIEDTHREWWHNYFQKSFLSIPNTKMESFYWIQIYKMAACSRADGPALDLLDPFMKMTGWPGLWWNLNVQLTYWPFNASNHLDIAQNFITLIDENFDNMLGQKRIAGGKSIGDFAWAMHNYWLYFSYLGDDKAIQDKWVPKAKAIAKTYEKKQITNDNGQIELAPMGSPEYHEFEKFANTNYNLAILRWLLKTLIDNADSPVISDADLKKWQNTLDKLIDYPVNENGLMIGSDQPVDMSHRHYSHLLGLYPLFQLNPDSPEDCALVEKSVKHWHNIEDGKGLVGYSYTGAASLYAAMRDGNNANAVLEEFLSGNIGTATLLPNTFYCEGHGKNPVIETPLSAAASTIEFLLQSWGGKIRVFPATPDKWRDASFQDLRAEGAFLISAQRKTYKTEWVAIESLIGKPCIVKIPDWDDAIQIEGKKTFNITKVNKGEFAINLEAGEKIIIAQSKKTKAVIVPMKHPKEEQNQYGVKTDESLKEIMEYDIPEYSY